VLRCEHNNKLASTLTALAPFKGASLMSDRLTRLSLRTTALAAAIVFVGVLPTADNAWGGERTPRGSGPSVPAAARPLTSILGVLRRPQSARDITPALHKQLVRESHSILYMGWFGTGLTSLVRLAAIAPWGQRVYLIPHLPPTRRQIAKLPSNRRVTVLTASSIDLYPMSGGPMTAAQVTAGRAWAVSANRYVFIFPDHVSKVALWRSISIRDHPHPLVSPGSKPIIVAVRHNVAAFGTRRAFTPGREIWYGSSGELIKRIANASSCGPPLGSCA
jgi:hypothetical protein